MLGLNSERTHPGLFSVRASARLLSIFSHVALSLAKYAPKLQNVSDSSLSDGKFEPSAGMARAQNAAP
jgi:hypothetical protein